MGYQKLTILSPTCGSKRGIKTFQIYNLFTEPVLLSHPSPNSIMPVHNQRTSELSWNAKRIRGRLSTLRMKFQGFPCYLSMVWSFKQLSVSAIFSCLEKLKIGCLYQSQHIASFSFWSIYCIVDLHGREIVDIPSYDAKHSIVDFTRKLCKPLIALRTTPNVLGFEFRFFVKWMVYSLIQTLFMPQAEQPISDLSMTLVWCRNDNFMTVNGRTRLVVVFGDAWVVVHSDVVDNFGVQIKIGTDFKGCLLPGGFQNERMVVAMPSPPTTISQE